MINQQNFVNADMLMRWEDGAMTDEEEIGLFQKLVNSGMAWELQSMYGRHAMKMIEAGLITEPDKDKIRKIMKDRHIKSKRRNDKELRKLMGQPQGQDLWATVQNNGPFTANLNRALRKTKRNPRNRKINYKKIYNEIRWAQGNFPIRNKATFNRMKALRNLLTDRNIERELTEDKFYFALSEPILETIHKISYYMENCYYGKPDIEENL